MTATRVGASAVQATERGSSSSLLLVVPGADDVAGADQLGGRVVADRRLAQQQPVEDEQADRARAGLVGQPAAARDVQ